MGFEKKNRPAVRVYYNSGNQSIPNNTWTPIMFDTAEFDTDGMFAGPNDHVTIKRLAGYYLIEAHAVFESTSVAGTIRALWIAGAFDYRLPVGAWSLTSLAASSPKHLVIGDNLYLWVYQDSGAAMDIFNGSDKTWLSVIHFSGR